MSSILLFLYQISNNHHHQSSFHSLAHSRVLFDLLFKTPKRFAACIQNSLCFLIDKSRHQSFALRTFRLVSCYQLFVSGAFFSLYRTLEIKIRRWPHSSIVGLSRHLQPTTDNTEKPVRCLELVTLFKNAHSVARAAFITQFTLPSSWGMARNT